jgi:hypothetical protein
VSWRRRAGSFMGLKKTDHEQREGLQGKRGAEARIF